MPRITLKYIQQWLNDKFIELEITEYEIFSVERTHYREYDYEGGAARLVIGFRNKEDYRYFGYFNCFYSLRDIEQHLKNGYELHLKFDRFGILSNCELDIRKLT